MPMARESLGPWVAGPSRGAVLLALALQLGCASGGQPGGGGGGPSDIAAGDGRPRADGDGGPSDGPGEVADLDDTSGAADSNDLAGDAPDLPSDAGDLDEDGTGAPDAAPDADASPDGGGPRVPKVLILGLDGTRPDALAIAHTPNLDALAAAGAFSMDAFAGDNTVSGPGWASILTGVWRDKHGIDDNNFTAPNLDAYPDLFTLLKRARPSASGASIVSWPPINDIIVTGADIEITHPLDVQGDDEDVADAVSVLSSTTLDPDVIFVYFGDIDTAGHAYGFHPRVPEYVAEIESVDAQIGVILAAMRARATYDQEDWLVLVTTDHGGTPDGTHGLNIPDHRRIFFIASGPSVTPGPLLPPPGQVDVVPTVLAHLGVAVDPAWDLDGRPRGLDEVPPAPAGYDRNLLVNGGAELDRGFSDALPDGYLTGWRDPGAVTPVAYDSPDYPTLAGPGPADRGRNLFIGGAAASSSIVQVVDVAPLATDIDAGQVTFDLSGYLGGYLDQADAAALTLTFLPDGALRDADPTALFFRDGQVIEYDVGEDAARTVPPAALAAAGWPDDWADGPDAAVLFGDGKAYLFRDGQVIRMDVATRRVDDGYPQTLDDTTWPGMWPEGPDAALEWTGGKVFFFRGDQYLRWDVASHTTDPGYPKAIDDTTWPGLSAFDAIDAVLPWGDGKVYFFRGSQYIRYDIATDQADSGYPRPIELSTWPGLWTDGLGAALLWPTPDTLALGSATIGPVTPADRGNLTGLLARSTSGAVPPSTRLLRLELAMTRAVGTVSDGYADDLSVVLHHTGE